MSHHTIPVSLSPHLAIYTNFYLAHDHLRHHHEPVVSFLSVDTFLRFSFLVRGLVTLIAA